MSDTESDKDEDWEGEEEETSEENTQPCPCLYCSHVTFSNESTLQHCREVHNIDMHSLATKLKLDVYRWIKLVNYIRRERPSASDVQCLTDDSLFRGEEYLHPVLPDDPLLQVDIDSNETNELSIEAGDEATLRRKLKETEEQLTLSRVALESAMNDLQSMREAMKELIADSKGADKEGTKEEEEEEEEDGYFSSYSYFGIHEEMLKDQIRMESYQIFISRNPELFKDKVVLDVGCGTGILSMFAVQSGASHVIAIDQSKVIYKAIEIARENGFLDKITFIRGQVEEVQLPTDKVDIIISEWMGYFLLFESMLSTVLYARDNWLKDRTQIYPNRCSLSLVALGDEYEYQSRVNFWDDVSGFKMSCLKEDALKEACIILVDQYSLISSSDVIKKFDLTLVKPDELDFESRFSLTVTQNCNCHGIVGFFDIGFEVPTYPVYFSTNPLDTPTHWKQTVFFFKEPIKVSTGDLLRGTLSCSRNKFCHRSLDVKLSMKLLPLLSNPSLGEELTVEQSFSIN